MQIPRLLLEAHLKLLLSPPRRTRATNPRSHKVNSKPVENRFKVGSTAAPIDSNLHIVELKVNSTHCRDIPKLLRGFVVGPRFLSKSLQSQPPVGHKACMLHTAFASPWSGRWCQIINVSPSQDHLQLPPVPASSSMLATLEGTSDEHKVGAKIFRNAELVFRFNVRVCQIGWARQPWAGPSPQILHSYRQGLGRPGAPNPSFLWTQRSQPAPPKSFTFIDGAGPPQTPHFYWPDPSLLSARPGGATPGLCRPGLPRVPPEQPLLFGKPSCGNALHG